LHRTANFSRRQFVLWALATLAIAYTRTQIQYGGWTSWGSAATSIVVHGIGFVLFGAFTVVSIGIWRDRLLPREEPVSSQEAILVYLAVGAIVACAWILLLFHSPGRIGGDT
jgi:hypothetical protein